MQVVVVADEKRESIGRKLVQAISNAEGSLASDRQGVVSPSHPWTAALWTEAKYRDNEGSLFGDQIVLVFVGPSQAARDLSDVMPGRFASLGTRCFVQGNRAIILADIPAGIDGTELKDLAEQLDVATRDVRDRAAAAAAASAAGAAGAAAGAAGAAAMTSAGLGATAALAMIPAASVLIPLGLLPGVIYLGARWNRQRLLRSQVNQAQYAYATARFVADELPTMGA